MKKLISLLFITLTTVAFAADENVEVVPTSPTDKVLQDTSEFHRLNKQWTFGVQLLGAGPSYATQQGLSVGYFLNRNMIIQAEFMTGKIDSDTFVDATSLGSIDVKGRSIGVHFKHFVGNSFYYRAGLDLRSVEYRYSDSSGGLGRFDGKSSAGTFNIGNQWQWSNFTLGCDWIGISVPLSHSYDNEAYTTGTYYDQEFNNDKELLTEDSNLNILRFYLGASF